jgi:hypothetical protein
MPTRHNSTLYLYCLCYEKEQISYAVRSELPASLYGVIHFELTERFL